MANEDVQITVSAQGAEAIRAIQAIQASVDALTDKLGKTGKQSRRAFSAKEAFKFAGAIVGVNRGVDVLLKGFQQINRELNAITARQELASNVTATLGQLERAVNIAVPTGANLTAAQFKDLLFQETGGILTQRQALTAAQRGLSARARLPLEQVVESIRVAGELNPGATPAELAKLTEAVVTTSERGGFSPRESISLIKNLTSLSRITDVRKFGLNIAPFAGQFTQMTGSQDDAFLLAQMLTAFTQIGGDDTGQRTRSNTGILLRQLRDMFRRRVGRDPRGLMEDMLPGLRQHARRDLEELLIEQRKVQGRSEFKTGGVGFVEFILNPNVDNEFTRELRNVQEQGIPRAQLEAAFPEVIADVRQGRFAEATDIDQAAKLATERIQTADAAQIRAGSAVKAIKMLQENIDRFQLEKDFRLKVLQAKLTSPESVDEVNEIALGHIEDLFPLSIPDFDINRPIPAGGRLRQTRRLQRARHIQETHDRALVEPLIQAFREGGPLPVELSPDPGDRRPVPAEGLGE